MSKPHHNINKVIDLLNEKTEDLKNHLKGNPNDEGSKILISQVANAVKALEFCQTNDLIGNQKQIIKLPQTGTDSYFTEFNLVDEGYDTKIPNEALVKNGQDPIILNGFDLIIRTK